MDCVKMSDIAYNEFFEFLEERKVENKTLRVFLAGNGWGGPIYNLAQDDAKETDYVTKINEVTFIMDKEACDAVKGVTITSGEENGKGGLSVEPNLQEGGGCSSCTSCG